jgi:hypothetical protein
MDNVKTQKPYIINERAGLRSGKRFGAVSCLMHKQLKIFGKALVQIKRLSISTMLQSTWTIWLLGLLKTETTK